MQLKQTKKWSRAWWESINRSFLRVAFIYFKQSFLVIESLCSWVRDVELKRNLFGIISSMTLLNGSRWFNDFNQNPLNTSISALASCDPFLTPNCWKNSYIPPKVGGCCSSNLPQFCNFCAYLIRLYGSWFLLWTIIGSLYLPNFVDLVE